MSNSSTYNTEELYLQHMTGYAIINAFFNKGYQLNIFKDSKFDHIVGLPEDELIKTGMYTVEVKDNIKLVNIYTKTYKQTKASKYKAGDFLYGYSTDSDVSDIGVFIYTGQDTADGYGVLIGREENNKRIVHSTGFGNFQWGGKVRRATEEEIHKFMVDVMNTEKIYSR